MHGNISSQWTATVQWDLLSHTTPLLRGDNYFCREQCQAVTPSPAKELKEPCDSPLRRWKCTRQDCKNYLYALNTLWNSSCCSPIPKTPWMGSGGWDCMCSVNCLHFGAQALGGKSAVMTFSLHSSEWLYALWDWVHGYMANLVLQQIITIKIF